MPLFEAIYRYPTPNITYFYQDHPKVQAVESQIEYTKETLQILK